MNWSISTHDELRLAGVVKFVSRLSWFAVLLVLACAGCSSSPPADPAAPAQYHVSGRVQRDAGISWGPGVVALLVPASGAIQNVTRENALLLTAATAANNAWPYNGFQRTMDDFQKSRILSAVMTSSEGSFAFPDAVVSGEYVVTIGIPIVHDPGVGKPVPRDWPENLVTEMRIKVLNREVSVPARNAWLLRVSVQNSDRSDVTLGSTEHISWPKLRPTDDQITKIRNRLLQLGPVRSKSDVAEKQFRDAYAKARQTGQPLDVRRAKEKENEFKKEENNLQQANKELDTYLEQMLRPSDS